jgi:uncharacterized membrane protein YhdT
MDYLIKVAIFAVWVTLLYTLTNLLTNYVIDLFAGLPALPWLKSFGFFTAFNLFLSILFGCFISKATIKFWMSA